MKNDSGESLRHTGKIDVALIDALRGIAALGVYFAHADLSYIDITGHGLHWSEGVFGVFLFFGISGFLIWSSAKQHLSKQNGLQVYAVHRFTRIYPLYIVALLFAALVLVPMQVSYHPFFSWGNFLRHLIFTQDISPPISRTLIPPSWSLTCEVAFYIMAPVVFIMRKKIPTWLSIPALMMISLYANFHEFSLAPSISKTMYGFMFGAALAEWPKLRLWIGILLLGIGFSGMDLGPSPFFEMRPLVALGILAIFVSPQARPITSSQISKVLLRPLAFVGLVSYSLYLWHYMLINVLLHYLDTGGKFWILDNLSSPGRGIIFLALMLAVSWASYQIIERPGMRNLRTRMQDQVVNKST